MDIQSVALIIVSVINLFWGLAILSEGVRQRSNRIFSLVIFSVVVWIVFIIGYRIAFSQSHALLLARLLYIAAIFIPLFFLYFTFVFPNQSKYCTKICFTLISLPAFLLVVMTLFSDLIIVDVLLVPNGEHVIKFGRLFLLYALYISGYFTWSLANLFISVVKNSGIIRLQLTYIFGGVLTSSIIGMITNLFLPWIGYYDLNWFGQVSTVLWVSITSFAIIRLHLLNLKAVATELLAGFLVIVSLIPIFQAESISDFIFKLAIFMVTAIFAVLIIRSVLREVRRREEMERLTKELQKATTELKKANKELKRLDNAKSEFLSIASHQLRTPLTVIKGYVSMMLEGSFGRVPKLLRQNLDKVSISTERLISLVESLLNISRIESGRLEFNIQPVDLAEITKSIVDDFQKRAKDKKLKLEFFTDPDLPQVLTDPQKVKEIMSNIIDNSIKYTDKGSVIVGLHQESQSVVFSCQDTGIGILPEDLPRLFEKFVRGKDMMQVYTEGVGLGMYFARMVVENMGGRIWAESPGKHQGSKFSFSLPLADKSQAKKVR